MGRACQIHAPFSQLCTLKEQAYTLQLTGPLWEKIVAVVHGRETNTTIQDRAECSENENHVCHHAHTKVLATA